MINPRELRIGNLFYKIDLSKEVHLPIEVPLKVVTIGFNGADCVRQEVNPALVNAWDNVDYKDMSPIPITEEWLIKLGFMQDEDTDYKEWFNLEGFHVCLNKPNNTFRYSGDHHASGGNTKAIVQYIHQLQNLYYALTSNELTVKEMSNTLKQIVTASQLKEAISKLPDINSYPNSEIYIEVRCAASTSINTSIDDTTQATHIVFKKDISLNDWILKDTL